MFATYSFDLKNGLLFTVISSSSHDWECSKSVSLSNCRTQLGRIGSKQAMSWGNVTFLFLFKWYCTTGVEDIQAIAFARMTKGYVGAIKRVDSFLPLVSMDCVSTFISLKSTEYSNECYLSLLLGKPG